MLPRSGGSGGNKCRGTLYSLGSLFGAMRQRARQQQQKVKREVAAGDTILLATVWFDGECGVRDRYRVNVSLHERVG